MFGRLVNGKFERAPKSVIVKNMKITATDEDGNKHSVIEDRRIINPKDDVLTSLGYFPVEETAVPTVEEGYRAIPSYERVGQAIVRKWVVEKKPKESPSDEERLLALEKVIERMEKLLSGKE